MKNHFTTLIAIIVLQLSLMGQTATAPAVGDGTSANPYQIATLENLYWLSQNPAEWSYKYFIQTANIDASASLSWDAGAGWSPIGNNTTKFSGYYYGQGYTVDGIFINRPLTDYIGLFGYVWGKIYDLGVTNVNIIGKNEVGALAGYLSDNALVENSFSSGVVTGNDYVGGITGGNYNGLQQIQISYCYSSCNITGHSAVGGLTGRNRVATINNCFSTGNVIGNGIGVYPVSGVGGLIGVNSDSYVYNSFCTGNVSGITNTGGFVGQNEFETDTIRDCFSRGNVTLLSGTSQAIGGFVGNNKNSAVIQNSYTTANVIGGSYTDKGFVGTNESGTHTNNFWDDDVSSQSSAVGATAKTTAEMKNQTTFINAGWDFIGETANGTNDYWAINPLLNDGYPFFNKPVEVNATAGIIGPTLYHNLKFAFTAINKGIHQGAITIKINGNVNETKSAVLNASGSGSANYSSILIYPTASGLSINGSIYATLIDFNGADNITIDGRVNQTGGTDLTIENKYIGYSSSAIQFINTSENNIIKYCTIKALNESSGSGTIYFSTTSSGNGNSGNLIDYCNITQNANSSINMIYSFGSAGFENKNNTISNCNFINSINPNSSSYGINLSSNNSDWSITANRFYETASIIPNGDYSYYFIRVANPTGNNFTINDNVIGGNAPDNSGILSINSTYSNQIYGILLNVGTTTASSVQNNTIKYINYTSASSDPFYGIHVNSGIVNVGTVTGNTIGSEIGTGSITITNSTANANSYGIYCTSTGSVNVENNKVGAITLIGSSTYAHSFYGIFKNSTGGTTIFRNNTIGSTVTENSINATSDAGSNTQVVCGICVLGPGANTISSNTIANLTNATTFASGSVNGIFYGGYAFSATINGNFIHSLSATSENPSINGIYYNSELATFSNNIISLGNGITNGNTFIGINVDGSNALNLFHNTVYIGGIASGTTSNTYALLSTASNTRVYKNNIFNNSRSGGSTGKHYAASISSATNLTIDYNDYYAPNGVLGMFSGTDKTTLTSWTSSVGGNTNSKNVDPGFSSAGGKVAANYLPSESSLAGDTGTGITTDYAGVPNSRSLTYPAMGAWEYTVVGCSAPSISSQSTATQTKCLNGTFSAITVVATGTGLNYQWFSNTVATTSGVGIVNLGSANGAQTNSYTPQATSAGTLYYYCVITDTCGTATSLVSEAFIVNNPPTAPTSITGTTTICSGNSTLLTASGGSEGLGCSYEWGTGSTVGLNIISGATSANYTTNTLTTNTTYWVRRVETSLCSNTTAGVSQLVEINNTNLASYSVADTSLCLNGNNFVFTNTSLDVNSSTWIFDDGVTYKHGQTYNILNFDGLYDDINVYSMPNPSGSFTIEANARMASKGNRTIVSKIGNGWLGYSISYSYAADRMECFMGSGSPNIIQSQAAWNLNQWYHVALVYDAATQTMSYYQDGVLQGSLVLTPSYSTQSFKIGNDNWSNFWHGDIDEVRVFNTARTISDIQSTMNTELTGSENGLTNYYNFNQGVASGNNTSITSIIDSKGTYNGSLYDFALNGSVSNFIINDSYINPINHSYSTIGNYNVKLITVSSIGCTDSITKTIYVLPHSVGTDAITACDSYTWIDGNTYTSSNNTATHTLTNASGCDSVVTLNLTINHSNTGIDVITACDSYTWIDGNTYTSSNNTATHTLTNAAGCDSVVTLNLTINQSNTGIDVKTACDSYTWIDGTTYTSSNNTATHTLTNASGCDSVVTLNLTINQSNTGIDVKTACDSYTWIDGNTYTSSNNAATHTLTNASGCDSVVTLNLTINQSNTGIDVKTACDSYTWIDGNTYTSSNNTATHTLTNASGCDSVVTLNLTINQSNTGIDVKTACDSYTWIDGNTYTSSNNTATHTLTNANGCDSVVTLNLTINHSSTGTDMITACNSYTWIDGVTYNTSNNTATHNFIGGASNGCDSLVTLNLTINTADTSLVVSGLTITSQAVGATYQWLDCANSFAPIQNQTSNIFVAIENGSFAVEVTENGCADTSFCVDITNVTIGNYQFANEINLYPNPTDGKVNIDFNEKQSEIKLVVRDITGKVLFENIFSNTNRISFNMDEPKGFYTVELSSINQKAVFKLIKQ